MAISHHFSYTDVYCATDPWIFETDSYCTSVDHHARETFIFLDATMLNVTEFYLKYDEWQT